MSNSETRLAEERLYDAINQWREQEVPAMLPESVVRSTLEALRKTDEYYAPRGTRREVILQGIRYGGIAATAAGLLTGALWLAIPLVDANTAFADVVEHAVEANSVRFRTRLQMGKREALASRVSIKGDMFRMEVPGVTVQVVDFQTRRAVAWNIPDKKGWAWEVPAGEIRKFRERLTDPIAAFRSLDVSNVSKVRSDRFAGKIVDVFEVGQFPLFGMKVAEESGKKASNVPAEIWVARESRLPVQIVVTAKLPSPNGRSETVRTVLHEFQWDESLSDETFQMEVPTGYSVVYGEPSSTQG